MNGPRVASLCSGYGGLDMAVQSVLGGELAWVADNDPGAAKILAHRYPDVPNHGDITAVDWATVEPVDILTAGFPCTDVSCAGARAGLRAGTRSGVWTHCARAIGALRPSLVVIENVRGLLSAGADSPVEPCPWCMGEAGDEHALRAAGAVLGDLADLGYDAQWATASAADAGAPHRRERVFILAWPAADTASDGRDEGWPEPARLIGGPDAAVSGHGPAPDTERSGRDRGAPLQVRGEAERTAVARDSRSTHIAAAPADPIGDELARERPAERRDAAAPGGGEDAGLNWGNYGHAIRRWEAILGRSAPRPTEPGRTGERLSPAFVEFLMGLPAGWVTQVPGLSRNQQLKALGNGVVPQQAAMALRLLLGVSDAFPAEAGHPRQGVQELWRAASA